jgi:N-methylhydantoinase A
MSYRVSIDIGGTFTDAFAIDEQGNPTQAKIVTTPADLKVGFLNCLDELARQYNLNRQTFLGKIGTFIHGTTQGTNAIIARSGPRMGIIATKGHVDTIQLRRVPKTNMWDWRLPYPQPLVARHLRVGVEERVDSKGNILQPLNEDDIHKAVVYFKKMGVKSIVVTLLFSFLNPIHERRILEIIQQDFPEAQVTLSHEVLPVSGEYERFSTAVIDAYLRPVMEEYLQSLEQLLKAEGFQGNLYLMQNNGGVTTPASSSYKPSTLAISGPAAGPTAAMAFKEHNRKEKLFSLDMGGTNADIALIDKGQFKFRSESLIGDHRFSLPIVEVESLGAGGSSVAWFDLGNTLHMGPKSAGANPGPACYGQGGQEATFTDAAVVLGYLNPDYYLEGKIKLQKKLAEAVIQEKVAKTMEISVPQAASAIYRVTSSLMASGISHAFTTKGYKAQDFIFCAGGSAAPLCALKIAQELKMQRIAVSKYAAVYTSLGMVQTDIRHDFLRFYTCLFTELDLNKLRQLYKEMEAEANHLLVKDGVAEKQRILLRTLRMKYYGQFRDLEVPWPQGPITVEAIAAGIANFHRLHKELFGSCNEKYPLEFMKFGLTAIGQLPRVQLARMRPETKESALKGQREAYFEENKGFTSTSIMDGTKMRPGDVLKGPCIVEEKLITIVIPPGFQMQVDEYGNYVTW